MSAFLGASAVLAMLALAVRLTGRQHRLLHLFQLEHYEPSRLLLWLRRRRETFAWQELVALGALYAAAVANVAAGSGWFAGALLLASTPIAAPGIGDWRREAVKPLVFTARAKRLFGLSLTPPALLVPAAIALAAVGLHTAGLAALTGIGLALLAGAPWTLLAADKALSPVQASINRRFLAAAKRTLAEVDPLVVGITGSYGKTTTKFCVGEVLGADRETLVTPESYNSHLGVTRTINERLQSKHRAFVVEMGMFRRGDVSELCELVHPKVGVITAIGPMHLERLGSIEQIALAKAELLEALPSDGHFVTNADDPRCVEIAARAHVPVTLFGIDNPCAQVIASDVRLREGRTVFALRLDGPASPALEVSAALLGRHNVSNLLAAAAVGKVLGVEPAVIAQGLSRVKAPEHRLQPIHNRAANVVVIDDAYNSNPNGAKAALEVLGAHPASRRLLVTPGMVELGELEARLNRSFGEQAAPVCDLAILVGQTRTAPIREGLQAGGMAAEAIHVVRDIAEATTLLGRLTQPGDVVLFENDLPDTYEEQDTPAGGGAGPGDAGTGPSGTGAGPDDAGATNNLSPA